MDGGGLLVGDAGRVGGLRREILSSVWEDLGGIGRVSIHITADLGMGSRDRVR